MRKIEGSRLIYQENRNQNNLQEEEEKFRVEKMGR
jgi:hypothetical protein